jgi:hypothetical protein
MATPLGCPPRATDLHSVGQPEVQNVGLSLLITLFAGTVR